MENLVFRICIFVYLILCINIRAPFVKKYKKNNMIKSENVLSENLKVILASLGMSFVPFVYIFSGILSRFDFYLPLSVRITAAAALILNASFFYVIHKTLDDNWSPVLNIKEDQKLIKTGIYKYIRHPMYTQCWLWVILTGLVSANSFVLIFGIISWGILYFTRVFKEETMMLTQFQDEYAEYMKTTGRIFPKII